jgi:hypothetical protein
MSVAPHAGIVDFGTFTPPTASVDGIQGEVPQPLAGEESHILSASGWIPPASASGTVTSVAATGGTGISVTGSPITTSGTLNITNTAPDQIVALTQGGTTTITGTYPNFTISSADQFQGTVTSVTGTSPVASTGGATPVISMPAATTLVSGYLTSTDWTTFNNKGSGTVTAVSVVSANGFAGISSGGATPALTLSTTITGVLKGNATAISAATSGTDYSAGTSALTTGILKSTTTTGALSIAVAADFPTLNQNTTGSAATLTTGRTLAITGDLAYTSPSFNGSANVTAAGTLATVNANVGSFTNASVTVNAKGLVTAASSGTAPVTSVTATSPVASTGGATPVISMPAATTSVSGYLTSTDWTTFNNKSNTNGTVTSVAALTLGTTGTDLSSTVATGTTTPVITLQVPTASATNRGALSAADWTTFNNKGSGTVTSVTGTAPVASSGGLTPVISMPAATTSVSGYLTSTDWNTFNGKGSGTVTSVSATVPSFLSVSGSPITTTGTLAITLSGTALPILNGGTGATTLAGASIATYTGTETLTNKRIDPRVVSAASAATLTPSVATADVYAYTALAVDLTINAPTGTPVDGDKLIFRLLDNGTSRALTWDATYTVIGVTLPTATTISKTTYVGCIYNANNTRWDVIAVTTQA